MNLLNVNGTLLLDKKLAKAKKRFCNFSIHMSNNKLKGIPK